MPEIRILNLNHKKVTVRASQSVLQAFQEQFIDWMLSKKGQSVIASYKLDGQQLFFPNAPSGS